MTVKTYSDATLILTKPVTPEQSPDGADNFPNGTAYYAIDTVAAARQRPFHRPVNAALILSQKNIPVCHAMSPIMAEALASQLISWAKTARQAEKDGAAA